MNIIPSYQCNLRCPFCGIKNQKGKLIDLDWLEKQFQQYGNDLTHDINILGGEPSILPLDYQRRLVSLCTQYAYERPYYITNLLTVSPVLEYTKPIISYDFHLRPQYHRILNNILGLKQPFAISTILTSTLVQDIGADTYLKFIDKLKLCYRADLVIYYPEHGKPDIYIPQEDALLSFVKSVMRHPKVCMAPLQQMRNIIPKSFEDMADFFAILPDNKYGVRLDYQHGAYKTFSSFEEAKTYYYQTVQQANKKEPCANCKYLPYCWYPAADTVCHGEKKMMNLFYEYANSII